MKHPTFSKFMTFTIILVTLELTFTNLNTRAFPIDEKYKAPVTFIFTPDTKNAGKLKASGTGFFVSIPNKDKPEILHTYLVTAKHVVVDEKTNKTIDPIFVRLNTIPGGSQIVKIPFSGENSAMIYFHQDKSVDIAVIPYGVNPKVFDVKYISENMFATKDKFQELSIREGDDVFFTGLFSHYLGNLKNYPIVRFGKIALITDEKLPWTEKDKGAEMLDLYLIECQSFGGNSGSPVFFTFGGDRDPKNYVLNYRKILLAGVMKGTYLDAKLIETIDTEKTNISRENYGIAGVIPSYKLLEILHSKEVKDFRDKGEITYFK